MSHACLERLEPRMLLASVVDIALAPGAVHRAALNEYDLRHDFHFTARAGDTVPLFVADTSVTGVAGRGVLVQRPLFELYAPGNTLLATLTPGERNEITLPQTGAYRLAVRAEVAPTQYHFSWGTPLDLELVFSNDADDVLVATEDDGKTVVRLQDRLAIFGRNDQAIVNTMTLYLLDGDDRVNASGSDMPLIIRTGAGNDLVHYGDGNTTVLGGRGDDTIIGGTGPALLRGGVGDDMIHSGTRSIIIGGDGNNDLLLTDRPAWFGERTEYVHADPATGIVRAVTPTGEERVLGVADLSQWMIYAVRDVDGDQVDDLVWLHFEQGVFGMWLSGDPMRWQTWGAADIAAWRCLDAVRTDQVGGADLVFVNRHSGDVGAWLSGKGEGVHWSYISRVDLRQWIAGYAADQNGNGVEDLEWIWRTNAGRRMQWYLQDGRLDHCGETNWTTNGA